MNYERLSPDRKLIVDKIKEYESLGLFNKDVEDDPETIELTPDKIDYLDEKPFSRLVNKFANRVAISYYEKLIKKGDFVIKDVIGLENYRSVNGGAIITCNHFSVLDNYAIFRAIRKDLKKGQNLYKIIREGNYTNFKGLFGFMFRHCNTLPLSSNMQTMKKFLKSIKVLLSRGEKILIYPEQAMWWNYRKPRPMQSGAFNIASSNNVPVIPAFITMQDGEKVLPDGSFVQEMTVWFLPPIYPGKDLPSKENAKMLMEKNYEAWKNLYENVYGVPLVYGD